MQNNSPILYVAIGASAGGLEPIENLIQSIPSNSEMAFFIIQHLSPDYKSLMNEILARHTSLNINKVEDSMQVVPNTIYLIPPKKEMVIEGGKLKLRDKSFGDQLSMPIDIFFRSLALEVAEKAVGVILSGSGTDGSRGVVDISRAGGFVMVQEQDTAKFSSMPQSAVDSGVVDRIIKVEDMHNILLDYIENPVKARNIETAKLEGLGELPDILTILREKYHIDFGLYKPGTIARRVERRMSMRQCQQIEKYYDILINDEGELNALYKDLLIGVTAFFRDPDAFITLEQLILTELITNRKTISNEVRVWVAGCATGEEVYSLAILCSEIMRRQKKQVNFKFFATDVHRESLNVATTGIYNESSLEGVSPDLLNRWFTSLENGTYQISADLRRMIVFAEHDVLKDPPFTNIDLLTCRNMLIYMKPDAQQKILSLFHFALKKDGNLFLGPSETLAELEVEFEILDKHWKMFRKRRDVRLPAHLRFPIASTLGTSNLMSGRQSTSGNQIDQRLLRAYDTILEKHVSTGYLLDHYHELIHTFGKGGQYLRTPKGRANLSIFSMVDGELKIALAAALQRAAREQVGITYKGIKTSIFPECEQAAVIVDPIPDKISDSVYFFVTFQPMNPVKGQSVVSDQFEVEAESSQRILDLEQEIQNLRENLQATVEELETSNEELQASNEELVASNEELQSTNEELHSVNEELYTVNSEYEQKIIELSRMTSDLDNFLNSTAIGTMFLDENYCIRKYTEPVTQVFNVLPHDLGRPIEHISNTVGLENITKILQDVFKTGDIYTEELNSMSGNWYLMRVLPYWGGQNDIEGIVFTFVDITTRKEEEIHRQQLTEQLHHSHKIRAIGTLAGGISHEFNNLLQAISAQMDLLALSTNINAEDRESLDDVVSMTSRAKDLIKGILSFSHKGSEVREYVNLNGIVRETKRTLEKTLPRNIKLQAELPLDPVLINADSSQIQQVLFNLATNARDAMLPGGELTFSTGIVDLSEAEARLLSSRLSFGKHAVLKVKDTGVGMESAIASEIFTPFYTTKDIGEGTGIGLSVVYGIVSSHEGHVECVSSVGDGTCFIIYFPLMEVTPQQPKVVEIEDRPEKSTPERNRPADLKLLVVDDEPPIRKLCKANLEKSGFTVFTAGSGEEALEVFEENKDQIDLVVLDMGMPGMGGEKCIQELKKVHEDVKIVIASGYLSKDYAKVPESYGATAFLGKPYKNDELVTLISELLGNDKNEE